MTSLKIQRVGGMLPALRPTVTHDWDSLDEPQQEAVRQWLAQPCRVGRPPHAEGMCYLFTLESDEQDRPPVKLSAAYADVPEPLRSLLPAAAATKRRDVK